MTDTKILDQNPVSGIQVPPQTPVGVANKEIGPTPSVIPEIRRAGPEVKHGIDQELVGLGVKEIQDRPDLTQVPDMQHAGPSVPPPTGPSGLVQSPLTPEEMVAASKTDLSNSIRWLRETIDKVFKSLRLKTT